MPSPSQRLLYKLEVSPSGYIYWFVNIVAEEPSREALQASTDVERRQRLLELFRDDQPFISHIIQGAETIFPEFLSYTLPKQPETWHKGPVVLVGDACSCNLAQLW